MKNLALLGQYILFFLQIFIWAIYALIFFFFYMVNILGIFLIF